MEDSQIGRFQAPIKKKTDMETEHENYFRNFTDSSASEGPDINNETEKSLKQEMNIIQDIAGVEEKRANEATPPEINKEIDLESFQGISFQEPKEEIRMEHAEYFTKKLAEEKTDAGEMPEIEKEIIQEENASRHLAKSINHKENREVDEEIIPEINGSIDSKDLQEVIFQVPEAEELQIEKEKYSADNGAGKSNFEEKNPEAKQVFSKGTINFSSPQKLPVEQEIVSEKAKKKSIIKRKIIVPRQIKPQTQAESQTKGIPQSSPFYQPQEDFPEPQAKPSKSRKKIPPKSIWHIGPSR